MSTDADAADIILHITSTSRISSCRSIHPRLMDHGQWSWQQILSSIPCHTTQLSHFAFINLVTITPLFSAHSIIRNETKWNDNRHAHTHTHTHPTNLVICDRCVSPVSLVQYSSATHIPHQNPPPPPLPPNPPTPPIYIQ